MSTLLGAVSKMPNKDIGALDETITNSYFS